MIGMLSRLFQVVTLPLNGVKISTKVPTKLKIRPKSPRFLGILHPLFARLITGHTCSSPLCNYFTTFKVGFLCFGGSGGLVGIFSVIEFKNWLAWFSFSET
jgi:hypothetical protein